MKNDQDFVDDLDRVVKRNYTISNFDVSSMAGEMKISERQLQRKVKALTGQSPVQHLRQFRLEKSLQYLREGVPVGEAAKAVGFSSHTYFTSCFRARYRITPQQVQVATETIDSS
jgi:AraC-like DNA-binding protein